MDNNIINHIEALKRRSKDLIADILSGINEDPKFVFTERCTIMLNNYFLIEKEIFRQNLSSQSG